MQHAYLSYPKTSINTFTILLDKIRILEHFVSFIPVLTYVIESWTLIPSFFKNLLDNIILYTCTIF